MVDDKYFSVLSFMVINFLGTLYLASALEPLGFVKELAILMILLILGSIILYSISRRLNYAYAASSLFFAIALMNLVYLYFMISTNYSTQITLLVLTAVDVFGFLFSLERIGLFKRKKMLGREIRSIEGQLRALKDKSEIIAKELKSLEDTNPRVIVEDIVPKKKTPKTKKKAAKKKSPKKATKKKAKKSKK